MSIDIFLATQNSQKSLVISEETRGGMSGKDSADSSKPDVSSSHPSGGTTVTASSPADGEHGQEDRSPFVDLKHWASPEQLLEMRRKWHDVVLQMQRQHEQLQDELQRVTTDRDVLAAEVEKNEKLSTLFAASRVDYERMRDERTRWVEEKVLLGVKVQELVNEVARLRGLSSHGQTTSATARRAAGTRQGRDQREDDVGCASVDSHAQAPDSDDRRDGTPPPLASVVSSNASADNELLRSELLAALEALRRSEFALREERNRSSLAAVMVQTDSQRAALERQGLVAKLDTANQRLRAMESRLDAANGELALVRGALSQAQQDGQRDRRELEAEVQRLLSSLETHESELEKRTIASTAEHREITYAHQRDVARFNDMASSTERALTRQLRACREEHGKQEVALQRHIDSLEGELAEEKHARQAAETRAHDSQRAAEQSAQLLLGRISALEVDISAVTQQNARLQDRAEALAAEALGYKVEAQSAINEVQRLSLVADALHKEATVANRGTQDAELLRVQLASATQQAMDAERSHERQQQLLSNALDTQWQQGRDKQRLLQAALSSAEKREATLAVKYRRLKDAVAIIDPSGEWRRAAKTSSHFTEAAPPESATVIAVGAADGSSTVEAAGKVATPKLDAVEMFRAAQQAAAQLAKTVGAQA